MKLLPPSEQPGCRSARFGAARVGAAALLAVFFGSAAAAEHIVSKQQVDSKLRYCEVCHGASAQGFHGYYPIPRLAGQQPKYMKNQLEAFVEHRRTNNIMFNVAHELSPAMLDALTESFQKLNPKPLTTSAAEDLIAAGKTI